MNLTLSEEEIIQTYGKPWNIEGQERLNMSNFDNTILGTIGEIPSEWIRSEPHEFLYLKYGKCKANILSSHHKISDVYHVFCNARALLIFSNTEKNKKKENLFIRSTFLLSSLMNYVICWDLSWQVIYLYYGPTDGGFIKNRKRYKEELALCNYESLRYRLTLARDYKIRDYLDSYQRNSFWNLLRKTYNYYKHQGVFFIPGLGLNDKESPFSANGNGVPLFYKEEFDVDCWEERLIRYHGEFLQYFSNIIRCITPHNYFEPLTQDEAIDGLLYYGGIKKR